MTSPCPRTEVQTLPPRRWRPGADSVLVLDVNKEYGPWLVKSERLHEAMNTLDTGAQRKPGCC